MRIVNLTEHAATPEQAAAGVYELDDYLKEKVKMALAYLDWRSQENIQKRTEELALIALAEGVKFAMIGGLAYLMNELEVSLKKREITPLYATDFRYEGCISAKAKEVIL